MDNNKRQIESKKKKLQKNNYQSIHQLKIAYNLEPSNTSQTKFTWISDARGKYDVSDFLLTPSNNVDTALHSKR